MVVNVDVAMVVSTGVGVLRLGCRIARFGLQGFGRTSPRFGVLILWAWLVSFPDTYSSKRIVGSVERKVVAIILV